MAVALVEDPSVRLIGNLVPRPGAQIDEIRPEDVAIGAPVRAIFERVGDAIVLPRWMLER